MLYSKFQYNVLPYSSLYAIFYIRLKKICAEGLQISLYKICENTGFCWPLFSRILAHFTYCRRSLIYWFMIAENSQDSCSLARHFFSFGERKDGLSLTLNRCSKVCLCTWWILSPWNFTSKKTLKQVFLCKFWEILQRSQCTKKFRKTASQKLLMSMILVCVFPCLDQWKFDWDSLETIGVRVRIRRKF